VSLDYEDCRWIVREAIVDVSLERQHRFWITAIIDYWTC
jgi:hypothetical protein